MSTDSGRAPTGPSPAGLCHALELRASGRAEDALAILQELAVAPDPSPLVLHETARTLAFLQRFPEALLQARMACEALPASPHAWLARALAAEAAACPLEALEAYESFLARCPAAHFELLGRVRRRLTLLREEHEPQRRALLGRAAAEAERARSAEPEAEEARALGPTADAELEAIAPEVTPKPCARPLPDSGAEEVGVVQELWCPDCGRRLAASGACAGCAAEPPELSARRNFEPGTRLPRACACCLHPKVTIRRITVASDASMTGRQALVSMNLPLCDYCHWSGYGREESARGNLRRAALAFAIGGVVIFPLAPLFLPIALFSYALSSLAPALSGWSSKPGHGRACRPVGATRGKPGDRPSHYFLHRAYEARVIEANSEARPPG